jgi:preprotein translocase subunit SecG
VSLLAIIDYGLVIIFFICITGLLLLYTRSYQQRGALSVVTPSLREAPTAYLFLTTLFILLIILTVLVQKRHDQNNVFE